MQILPTPAATPLGTTGGSSDGFTLHFPSPALLVKFLAAREKSSTRTQKERKGLSVAMAAAAKWITGSKSQHESERKTVSQPNDRISSSASSNLIAIHKINSLHHALTGGRQTKKTHSFQPQNAWNSPCAGKEFLRLVETIMTHDARLSAVIAGQEIPRKLLGQFFVLFLIPHH